MQKLRKKKLPKHREPKGTLEDYYKKLKGMGYLEVGAGFYSRAFSNGDQVIKVAVGDAGYDAYLEYVLANQDNPYFPKVFDIKRFKDVWPSEEHKTNPNPFNIVFQRDVTVVTMEKLKRAGRRAHKISSRYDRTWNSPVAQDEHEQVMFDTLSKLAQEFYIDMHSQNVMLRGDQPVVIDPVVG